MNQESHLPTLAKFPISCKLELTCCRKLKNERTVYYMHLHASCVVTLVVVVDVNPVAVFVAATLTVY